ncbi:MAG TPA: DUF2164 domain-containing protein [Bacillales bacterium]|nr:DUF2164 domain-containing protein [Bacillales bacterium]
MYGKFPKEKKDRILVRIQQYFLEERDETIGDLAAENFLHFITEEIGPFYYNQGLQDAGQAFEERTEAIEEDLLSLHRPTD